MKVWDINNSLRINHVFGPSTEAYIEVVEKAEFDKLREWINTIGRTCPSEVTIDRFLEALDG